MASDYADRLALRRETLLLKIQAQRQLLSLQTQDVGEQIAFAEWSFQAGQQLIRLVRHKPLAGIAVVAGIVAVKPARLLNWFGTSFRLWKIWRQMAPLLKQDQPRS